MRLSGTVADKFKMPFFFVDREGGFLADQKQLDTNSQLSMCALSSPASPQPPPEHGDNKRKAWTERGQNSIEENNYWILGLLLDQEIKISQDS